jgi:hypothetical protein
MCARFHLYGPQLQFELHVTTFIGAGLYYIYITHGFIAFHMTAIHFIFARVLHL